ncbi:MAG TPA: formylglycine-generating enzyme family protein [Deltaproteobacteria bacterium]|nr:formylglycine-generating enzyme family protein [Deltaproteobacteria bacterium]
MIVYQNRAAVFAVLFLLGMPFPICASDTTQQNAIIETIEKNMILIPAGEFIMGGEAAKNETPIHKVHLDAYCIGKYEVTFEEYELYCRETGYNLPVDPRVFLQPDPSMIGPKMPVINVARGEAERFCQWLSEKTGKNYRLPTEAEWEKAARGGLNEKEYPWGDEEPWANRVYRANYGPGLNQEFVWKKDGYAYTAPVGTYPPNGYGLHDVAGNVWEWCRDWYDAAYYEKSPYRNPMGPDTGFRGVIRGGCYSSKAEHLRCATRLPLSPGTFDQLVGFRVARDP